MDEWSECFAGSISSGVSKLSQLEQQPFQRWLSVAKSKRVGNRKRLDVAEWPEEFAPLHGVNVVVTVPLPWVVVIAFEGETLYDRQDCRKRTENLHRGRHLPVEMGASYLHTKGDPVSLARLGCDQDHLARVEMKLGSTRLKTSV